MDQLQDLDVADRAELMRFVQNEQEKAKFQNNVHTLTDMCWKRCLASQKVAGPNLNPSESSCLSNCVNRFIDTQKAIVGQLERLSH